MKVDTLPVGIEGLAQSTKIKANTELYTFSDRTENAVATSTSEVANVKRSKAV